MALQDSLKQHHQSFCLHVLLIDGAAPTGHNASIKWYTLKDVSANPTAATIIAKYSESKDRVRWSLKPVFMSKLLGQECGQLVYIDNDICFFGNTDFLFDLLEKHSLLLTPHHYKYNPKLDQNWFEANYRVGLYNAGFVAANKYALQTLQWWADCCAYRCEKNPFRGLFDDQKYLDLVPVIEPNAHILQHKGCNLAGWNIDVCKRTLLNESVLINGEYPVVFIHFNDSTIREIKNGNDPLLMPHYNTYLGLLKTHRPNLDEKELLFQMPLSDKIKFGIWKILTDFGR